MAGKVYRTKIFKLRVDAAQRLETVSHEAGVSQTKLLEQFMIEPELLEKVAQLILSKEGQQDESK